jgi:hypothetical protein
MRMGKEKNSPTPTMISVFLRSTIKKSHGREKSICFATTCLGGGESFPWGKCARIARLWASIISGREASSLKIAALRAIQTPQRIIMGSALMFLNMWSYTQVLQASSMEGPSQLKEKPTKEDTSLQVCRVKGHIKKRCVEVSSLPLHKGHQLGPSNPLSFILSQVGTFILMRHHMNIWAFSGHLDFQTPFHHQSGACGLRLIIKKE